MKTMFYASVMAANGAELGQTESVETVPECKDLIKEIVQEFDNHPLNSEFYTIWERTEDGVSLTDDVAECMPVDALRNDSIIHDQLVLGRRAMSLLGRLHMFLVNNERNPDPIVQAQVKMAVQVLESLEVE